MTDEIVLHIKGVWVMYVDEYVISGFVIIALTIAFFGGVYRFIKNDIAKHAGDKQS